MKTVLVTESDVATVTVESPTGVALSGFTAEPTNLLLPMAFVALVVTILGAGSAPAEKIEGLVSY